MGVQLRDSLKKAVEQLTTAKIGSPRLNAETLLMFVLGCDRAYLHAYPERELTADESSRYDQALAQRVSGIPAQYITGHQEFWGMDLIVSPAVLIPRPETEHLIEAALEILKSRKTEAIRIADVGTGSGAIALALAKELPRAEIEAIDISPAALEIARANAARHQLKSRIRFREGDLLAGVEPATLDFVVSNPPYVGEVEEDQVQLEVRKHEPRSAVFSGPKGTEVIVRLVPEAYRALRPGGWLLMEISGTIALEVRQIMNGWDEVRLRPDLQSIPRVVQGRKPLR
jgi:release factor glutamine methyltransferase